MDKKQMRNTLLLVGDEKLGLAIPPKTAFSELFKAAFESAEKEDAE